ncbi:metal ABC transporter ATP-binding protein [Lachnoclostridium phytofermentans]|uniref:ABC transporter related n=1 Tax=Lachnoclostridium phytofermentans (strain ATCC 700394 / DSM 18823 / ISDg) TaxID=357809 RepID=A9KHF9_LACP7|nr:metal ABC transporter ATP-binding protein [Lachnoclostridium phytofermentans]ABX40826.1 ABC transporter related [Lachnoclostridium phytofermentans ISDg]
MALISCSDTVLAYDEKVVVSNLNFHVREGEYLCIVGENGSGKSTLIKTILGLKTVSSGTITYGDGIRANEIGYLPQQTEIQKDFPALVKEVVLSGGLNGCGLRPFYNKYEKSKARRNMELLNIENLENKCYRELSGGQKQRVLLARALCASKKLLLLDEPVTGLDPNATKDMYDLIEKLNKENHVTVLMVSHDISAAVKYATHILHIGNTPLFYGSKGEYLESEIGRIYTGKAGTLL